jgi:hypothetical protein
VWFMGLLRRNPRPPSSPQPPGDWIDALQVAMHVDPSLRPKRDPAPFDRSTDDEDGRRAPIDYGEIRLADAPEPPPERPPPADRPWLPPVSQVVIAPAERGPATQRAAIAGVAPAATAAPAAVEDLFQWVCRLSRMRRAGPTVGAFAAEPLRAEADRYLGTIAVAGPVGQRLREPLASFVDVVMLRGGLPIAGGWRPLGPVPAEAAYGAAAAAAVADPTGLHDGTWAVHHAALSLVADLVPDGPAALDALDGLLQGGAAPPGDRVCPSAYEGLFDHAIVRPVGRPLRAVAAVAVGMLLLAVSIAVLLNVRYVGQLRGSIDAVDRALRQVSGEPGAPRPPG